VVTGRINQQVKLKDGRNLGYAEYGDIDGKPIICFHGHPSSRLDWTYFNDAIKADDLNIRVLVPDRPGMGLSDFQSGRKVLDWPDDVIELADTLNLDRFAIIGISGGGPYAAACVYKIPERLTHTAIISGMGPSEAPGSKKGTAGTFPGKPSIMRKLMLSMITMGLRKKPNRFERQMINGLKGRDKELFLAQHELPKAIISSWQEAFSSGIAGVNHDAMLYTCPWQFRLQDISVEILLWYGT